MGKSDQGGGDQAPVVKKLLLALEIPVRWADQDVNGHVNNTKYFTYFEQVRIDWLRSQRALNNTKEGAGCVVAQASCSFTRPIPHPETVEVRMYAGRIGRSSFTLSYEILGSDRDTRYGEGQTVMVWIDRQSGTSLPLPDFLRAALQP